MAAAHAIAWKSGDEILITRGEFPAHPATWMPLAERESLTVKIVAPAGRFLTADDLITKLGPRTRLVSVSLVRFDDASLLDAQRLTAECHPRGVLVLLDVSQCAGAMPMDARALGADFMVCAGYKWLLSPYGTGFFWARPELIERLEVGPFYWMALEGANRFDSLSFPEGKFRLARGARRWDSPETSSFFNLAAMDASLEFLLRAGVETVWEHNRRLIAGMIERLPRDRCVLASPAGADERGPYACVQARRPEATPALFEQLREAGVIVSLRQGALRVAPHLYNSERDIDRLLSVLAA
jgi:selenocysteine lyase/cysteine desulfurase